MDAPPAKARTSGFFDRLEKAYERTLSDERIGQPTRRPQDRRRVMQVIRICWVILIVKSLLVVWACDRHETPFSPLWIVAPTLVFGMIATVVYYYWDSWFGPVR